METFRCECCDLDHPNRVREVLWEDYSPPTLCGSCQEHRGKPLQRAEDHADEYARRMDVAVRAAREAHATITEFRAETERAFKSRDRAVEALSAVANQHERHKNGGCTCGRSAECPTLRVLTDPWVTDRIVDFSLKEDGRRRSHFHTETGDSVRPPRRGDERTG